MVVVEKFKNFSVFIINWVLNSLFVLGSSLIGVAKVKNVSTSDVELEEGVKLRIYSPQSPVSVGNIYPAPVILYIHGGGWSIGNITIYDSILRYLASKSLCIIVGVEYRKAPRYKFPTAFNDCCRAYQWVTENIAQYGGNCRQLIFAGDSAGGNLALSLYHHLQQTENKVLPKLLVLFYPVLDISDAALNVVKKLPFSLINRLGYRILCSIRRNYLTQPEQANSPLISIKLIADKLIVPKTLLITAEYDPLNPQLKDFYRTLRKRKQALYLKNYPNTIHGFINFSRITRKSLKALNFAIKFIRMNLSGVKTRSRF